MSLPDESYPLSGPYAESQMATAATRIAPGASQTAGFDTEAVLLNLDIFVANVSARVGGFSAK